MREILGLTIVLMTCLGCGIVAGVFFAFSTFVMAALKRRPAHEAIGAMQAINAAVLNAWFLGVFLGTGGLCVVALTVSVLGGVQAQTLPIVVGCLRYLVGTLGVTMVCNVPRNNALARVEPTNACSGPTWNTYEAGWTAWNHVRTAAAVAPTGAFTVALTM